jgi:hypothetical protein
MPSPASGGSSRTFMDPITQTSGLSGFAGTDWRSPVITLSPKPVLALAGR